MHFFAVTARTRLENVRSLEPEVAGWMMLGQYCTCKGDDILHFPIFPVLNAECRNVLAMFEQPSDQCLDARCTQGCFRSSLGVSWEGIWKGFLVLFLFSPHPSFRKAWCLDWPHLIARHLDCVFFCKIVDIEHFALRVAIFGLPPPTAIKPRRLPPRYIKNRDGRPYRLALDPDDLTRK